MRSKTLICLKLISAIISAIISFGFLASICCCNCGSAYADDAVADSELANAQACVAAQLEENAAQPSSNATAAANLCRVKKGHTDVFATYKDAGGNLVLGTRGDAFPGTTKNGVRYDPSLVRFIVGNKSRVRKGKTFSFVKQNVKYVYHLSSQMEEGKLYAGVSTEPLSEDHKIKKVTFSFENAKMPENGAVYMAGKDDGAILKYLGTSGTDFPSEYTVDNNAHVHMDWVFTVPGMYILTVKAVAETSDGNKLTATQDYTFEVDLKRAKESSEYDTNDQSGESTNNNATSQNNQKNKQSEGKDLDDEDGNDSDNEDEESEDNEDEDDEDSSTSIVINGNNNRVYVTPWPGVKPNGGLANQSSDEEDGNGKSEGGNGSETESKGKDKKQKTVKKCSKFKDLQGDKLVIKHGHVDLATYSTGNGIGFAVQEDVTGSHVKRDPSKVVFYAGKLAKDKGVWRLPQTQKNSVPWVGWSNQNLSPHKPSKISLKSVKGPGSVRIWLQGGLGVKAKTLMSSSGNSTYTIPANTHMHLNWDFSKSGYYTITFAVSANGKTVTKDFHFAIGVDPMEKPMSCSMTKVDDEDGDSDDKSNETDENGDDSENNSDDEDKQNNNNNNDNNNNNSGNNGNSGNNSGTTPLAAAARGNSGSGGSFFGGGIGASKSANRGKTGRSVSLSGGIGNHANKGIQSKYNSKRVKGLRKSLQSGVKSEEPRGIVGLFKRKPVVAYTALSLGITAISGTCAAGLFVLRKRGLIPAGSLFRALMNLK